MAEVTESHFIEYTLGLLHKTLTGEKTPVKSKNSGKHNFTIDFAIGKKPLVKITRVFLRLKFYAMGPLYTKY